MTPVERLVAAGIRPDCAAESVMWYQAQGDDYGLQKYLDEVEARKEALDNGRISLLYIPRLLRIQPRNSVGACP